MSRVVICVLILLVLLLCDLNCEFIIILIAVFVITMADTKRAVTGGKPEHKLTQFQADFLKRDTSKHRKSHIKYDKVLADILASEQMPAVSHLPPDAKITTEFSRLLNLNNVLPYKRRNDSYKPALHWGQLKLFLSEVEFLNRVILECKMLAQTVAQSVQTDAPPAAIRFVYAGSAPGHHIAYLSELFPSVHFELYDPNEFAVQDSTMIKTHVQFFTDSDAKHWADYATAHPTEHLVFCSDIRTEPATQENIVRNMSMQLKWWQIMNPILSMFKFRLPWEAGKTDYLAGDIMIQAYPGATSSETRLICKQDAEIISYDNTQYESACYYHNYITRNQEIEQCRGLVLDKCYDCMSFEHVMQEYLDLKLETKQSGLTLAELIIEVQDKITFGKHDVLHNTIKQITTELDKNYRGQFVECGNKRCNVCLSGYFFRKDLKSRATVENEQAYLKGKK